MPVPLKAFWCFDEGPGPRNEPVAASALAGVGPQFLVSARDQFDAELPRNLQARVGPAR